MVEVIIIKKNDKPYFVGQKTQIKDHEFLELVKECQKEHENEENEKAALIERVKLLESEIRKLNGRLLVDEGKITQEEYDNGSY